MALFVPQEHPGYDAAVPARWIDELIPPEQHVNHKCPVYRD